MEARKQKDEAAAAAVEKKEEDQVRADWAVSASALSSMHHCRACIIACMLHISVDRFIQKGGGDSRQTTDNILKLSAAVPILIHRLAGWG